MNATLSSQDKTNRFSFNVEFEDNFYNVTIYTNEKGKIIDDSITLNDDELAGEGTEGQIREDIITYLDENWDTLVK